MRKTCNVVFISSIVLIILSVIAPVMGLTNQPVSDKVGSGIHFLIIFLFSIVSVYASFGILAFIFIFSLIGYLLTFGKHVKWKITSFKVLNSISDFLWFILLGITLVMTLVSIGNLIYLITYAFISLLTLAKIIYDIYLIHIKKGVFDTNKAIEEFDNPEFNEPIEADYQISDETINDESNSN